MLSQQFLWQTQFYWKKFSQYIFWSCFSSPSSSQILSFSLLNQFYVLFLSLKINKKNESSRNKNECKKLPWKWTSNLTSKRLTTQKLPEQSKMKQGLNKQTRPQTPKPKTTKPKQNNELILCWPTTTEHRPCPAVGLIYLLCLHGRKLIFLLTVGIIWRQLLS